ncbi:hypothetical protein M1146_07760 [Patescibacteria group bacterium]|nr:hypothetical protein [Patescibacteria group bacterium]
MIDEAKERDKQEQKSEKEESKKEKERGKQEEKDEKKKDREVSKQEKDERRESNDSVSELQVRLSFTLSPSLFHTKRLIALRKKSNFWKKIKNYPTSK